MLAFYPRARALRGNLPEIARVSPFDFDETGGIRNSALCTINWIHMVINRARRAGLMAYLVPSDSPNCAISIFCWSSDESRRRPDTRQDQPGGRAHVCAHARACAQHGVPTTCTRSRMILRRL